MKDIIKAYNFNLLIFSESHFNLCLKYEFHPADESQVDDRELKGIFAFIIAAS